MSDKEFDDRFIRYLQKKYDDPVSWAQEISTFFKALAAHMEKCPRREEGVDGVRTFKRVLHALKDVAKELRLNERIEELAGIPHDNDSEEVEVVNVDVDANRQFNVGDPVIYRFLATTGFLMHVDEEPPVSVVHQLGLRGTGPVMVTIAVQKKGGATATATAGVGVDVGGGSKAQS